jgi:hypothetical protein
MGVQERPKSDAEDRRVNVGSVMTGLLKRRLGYLRLMASSRGGGGVVLRVWESHAHREGPQLTVKV